MSMDLGFENFVELLGLSSFGIVVRTQARLSNSFLTRIFFQMVVMKKEYMKLNVRKEVNFMTRGNCNPTDSVKSCDDYSNLVHNIGTRAYVDLDKTNPAYLIG